MELGVDVFEKVSYGTDIDVKFHGLHLLLQFSETFGVRWLILLFFFLQWSLGEIVEIPLFEKLQNLRPSKSNHRFEFGGKSSEMYPI